MGKKRTHRGKPGGKRRFLRGLTRELNQTREFDPSLWWVELPPILPPPEEVTISAQQSYPSPPRNIFKEIAEFRRRAARTLPDYVPTRIPTRPVRPSIYTKKPIVTRTIPKITSDIIVNLKIKKTTSGFIIH